VPCNPVCCVNCFAGETGRENDSEHKTGSIFANAASVLSMAAEEISLDDHLEKELANEVELWRMETTSTAVHTNDSAYRQVFAPVGREGHGGHSVDSSSALSPSNGGIESDLDDMPESLGESAGRDRGRGSADFAYGGIRRGAASGTREGTGLSTESSGTIMRQSFSTPVTESREQTGTSSLPNGAAGTAGSGEDTRWGPIEGGSVASKVPTVTQPPQTAKVGEHLSNGTTPAVNAAPLLLGEGGPARANTLGAADTADSAAIGSFMAGEHRVDALHDPIARAGFDPRSNTAPAAIATRMEGAREKTAPAAIATQMEAAREKSIGIQEVSTPPDGAVSHDAPRDDTQVVTPQPESTAGWLQAEADETLPNETSSLSSSEEDSFPGFIEDPLEKEMQAPAVDDILHNYRGPGSLPADIEDRSARVPSNPSHQAIIKPTPKASLTGLEGVRSDRSAF